MKSTSFTTIISISLIPIIKKVIMGKRDTVTTITKFATCVLD